jgi:transposase
MSYPSDLTDDQWELLEPVFNTPGKRGRMHAGDLRTVVNGILCTTRTTRTTRTGCPDGPCWPSSRPRSQVPQLTALSVPSGTSACPW